MSLVSRKAPDFKAQAVLPDNTFGELNLSSYRGKYVILFFYPLDITFMCPSEIIAFDRELAKFKEKNAENIGVSVDSRYTHHAWRRTQREKGGIGEIGYPLVSDLDKTISRSFGILNEESVALRGLFIIDREGVVHHELVNDLSLGRSIDETLRMLEALQYTEKYGEVCPADWREGEDALTPTAEGAASYLARHSA